MTSDYESFVQSSFAAEREGDAATALEYHRGVPMFSRSAHTVQLTQLAEVSEEMTPWIWARWAAYQCTRAEDGAHRSREIVRTSLDYTVRMFYEDRLEEAYVLGGDPKRITSRLMGEGWLFHQLCTFEMGGLAEFLESHASGRLEQDAELASSWGAARMGGYHLERGGAGSLVVRDLSTDRSVTLLDLGASVHADAGGWLVGRLVPSGATPALMFDSRPIAVDEKTARAVAGNGTFGGWVTDVLDGIEQGRVDRSRFESEDRELVTDIPSLSLLGVGTSPEALAATLDQLSRGRDEIGRAAFRILRQVAEGRFGPDERAAYVAAAVLNPHGHGEAQKHLLASGRSRCWSRWAGLVPEPARGRLFRFADASRQLFTL